MWITALVVGGAQVLAHRYGMNADGMSYLDLADAWRRGQWGAAINAYWSPLYSWLLAVPISLVSPAYEAFAAKLLSLAAAGCALLAFERLWRELRTPESADDHPTPLRHAAAAAVALWGTLELVGVMLLTPDILVLALALLAFALLARATRTGDQRDFLLLGLVLGAGYLAKAVMFPVALLAIAAGLAHAVASRRATRGPALAALAFAAVALPLVVALSVQKGRPTFGDSGRINYAFYVNRVPPVAHWQGGPPGSGMPVHPTRMVTEDPDGFEFARPIPGTYPPWYDPSYWYEGVRPSFDLRGHAARLAVAAPMLWFLFWPPLVVLLAVLVAGGAARETVAMLESRWPVALVAQGAVFMYALVYVEQRYLAPFVVTIWLWILASLRARPGRAAVIALASGALAIGPVLELYDRAERDVYASVALATGTWRDRNHDWEVAERLRARGIVPGTRIVRIGNGARSYWARLAGLRIVAELPTGDARAFWELPPVSRAAVLDMLARSSGATLFVTEDPGTRMDLTGWCRLGGTGALLVRGLQPCHEVQPPVEQQARGPGIQAQALPAGRAP